MDIVIRVTTQHVKRSRRETTKTKAWDINVEFRNFKAGTRNARSLCGAGLSARIVSELDKYGLMASLAVRETKWFGIGNLKTETLIFSYCGGNLRGKDDTFLVNDSIYCSPSKNSYH